MLLYYTGRFIVCQVYFKFLNSQAESIASLTKLSGSSSFNPSNFETALANLNIISLLEKSILSLMPTPTELATRFLKLSLFGFSSFWFLNSVKSPFLGDKISITTIMISLEDANLWKQVLNTQNEDLKIYGNLL